MTYGHSSLVAFRLSVLVLVLALLSLVHDHCITMVSILGWLRQVSKSYVCLDTY